MRAPKTMSDAFHQPAILPEVAPVAAAYDGTCVRCPRLVAFLGDVRARYPHYHCRPVAPFGDAGARLLVVGMAPGMHGANASGRPFTGDHAGILLYATLHEFGFALRRDGASVADGQQLVDCRITNAVKCLPPDNKPTPQEVRTCNAYLAADLARVPAGGAILALGRIAHEATLRALGRRPAAFPFGHGKRHPIDAGRLVVDSYHCSRYNTNTRRLTAPMFAAAVALAAEHIRAHA
jgi:uracil-DNA glycosylase family 4